MKFVQIDEQTGAVSWDRYFEYLEGNKHAFPDAMYSYVADWDKYSLDGENSLHDAWIDQIRFLRSESELDAIEIRLLGPKHDRMHRHVYGGVSQFDFCGLEPCAKGANDLIVHEFTVDGLAYTHEMRFGGSARLFVKFETFWHQVDCIFLEQPKAEVAFDECNGQLKGKLCPELRTYDALTG